MQDSSQEFQGFGLEAGDVEIRQLSKKKGNILDYQYLVEMSWEGPYPELSSDRLKDKIGVFQVVLASITDPRDFSEFINDTKNEINGELKKQMDNHKKQVFLAIFRIFLKHMLCFLSFLRQQMPLSLLNKNLGNPKTHLMVSGTRKEGITRVKLYFKTQDQSTSSDKSDKLVRSSSSIREKEGNKDEQTVKLKKYIRKLILHREILVLPNQDSGFYFILKNKEEQIGQGGYGIVYRSVSITCRQGRYVEETWAVKQLKRNVKQQNNSNSGIHSDREWRMLAAMSQLGNFKSSRWSQNIIKIKQVLTDLTKRYIIYEYCPFRDLSKFTNPQKSPLFSKISKKHIFLIIFNLIATLKFIHYELFTRSYDFTFFQNEMQDDEELKKDKEYYKMQINFTSQKGIVHRDIKPANIVVKSFGEHWIDIKVIDWGFSKNTVTGQKMNSQRCGTESYLAPEFDIKHQKYCCKVDIWAFGMTVFCLLTGKSMFKKEDHCTLREDKKKVKDKIAVMKFLADKLFTEQEKIFYKEVLERSLEVDVEQRYSSRQLFELISSKNKYRPLEKQDKKYLNYLKILRIRWTQLQCDLARQNKTQILRSFLSTINAKINTLLSLLINKKMQFIYGQTEEDQHFLAYLQEQQQQIKKSCLQLKDPSQLSKNHAKTDFQKVIYLLSMFKFSKIHLDRTNKIIEELIQTWQNSFEI